MDDQGTPMSFNQLVAHNVERARRERGVTQQQLGAEMEQLTGAKWSKATVSAAERSVDGRRIRHFDADEIMALAVIFDLPMKWFFLPPADQEFDEFRLGDGPGVVSTVLRHQLITDFVEPSEADRYNIRVREVFRERHVGWEPGKQIVPVALSKEQFQWLLENQDNEEIEDLFLTFKDEFNDRDGE